MRRRRFLHLGLRSLAAGTVLPAAGGVFSWSDVRGQSSDPAATPLLAVAHGSSPDAITRAAVGALGGMARFVGRNDRVVIKPNIGWDRKPEQAANTNPEVVASLVRMCLESGARSVQILDNTCNDARRCYLNSGIEAAAKEAGAVVDLFEEERTRKMKMGGELITEWLVHPAFTEADVLINVPVAKHHSLSRLTLGMKNWLGAVGGARGRLHQNLDAVVVDFAAFFKPALTVVDGVRIMTSGGPQGGSLKNVTIKDTVIAGVDPVAADTRGVLLHGLDPADFPYLAKAAERGLGRLSWAEAEETYLEI